MINRDTCICRHGWELHATGVCSSCGCGRVPSPNYVASVHTRLRDAEQRADRALRLATACQDARQELPAGVRAALEEWEGGDNAQS